MTKQIDVLKRNISLHKQMEKQLAKRAYKAQKKIAELKSQVETLERKKNNFDKTRKPAGRSIGTSQYDLEGQELIDFLEDKLEEIEKKWS